jgi:hypothetical protein
VRSRVAVAALAGAVAVEAALPGAASAHGLVQKSDLPIPKWLFGWGAAVILIVSFVALAVLWPKPKLEQYRWRPLPGGVGRVLGSRAVEILCGLVGVFLLFVLLWAGIDGEQTAATNWTPTFVFVVFWVGLVVASILFGDVFRAFNPWRAIARAVAWVSTKAAGGSVPAPMTYPERLGHFPAAATIFGFAFIELAYPDRDVPDKLAIAVFVYSAVTFIGMALYGVERWIDRAEGFAVYFGMFARISPFETRDRVVGLRPPLTGLTKLQPLPGTVPLLAVMIGTVSFDGFSGGSIWQGISPDIARFFQHALSPAHAIEVTYTLGLVAGVTLIYSVYRLGSWGAASLAGRPPGVQLDRAFVHSLVPIAAVYVLAHYLTLLIYQGQGAWALASNPLGRDWDLFGTAGRAIDYGAIGSDTVWYVWVVLIVIGHVSAIVLAHDRAVALYDSPTRAVRSQYWMLGVMIFFTSLALWLLSQLG